MKSSWWPSIIAALTAGVSVFVPAIQGAIAAHPAVSTILGLVAFFLGHVLPQPPGVPQSTK